MELFSPLRSGLESYRPLEKPRRSSRWMITLGLLPLVIFRTHEFRLIKRGLSHRATSLSMMSLWMSNQWQRGFLINASSTRNTLVCALLECRSSSAGVDSNGPQLFLTDPSGTYVGYYAIAIGAGADQVGEYLEQRYREDISIDDALTLAVESIYLVSEDKIGTRHIKMAVVPVDSKQMRRLVDSEIDGYAEKAKQRSSKPSPSQ